MKAKINTRIFIILSLMRMDAKICSVNITAMIIPLSSITLKTQDFILRIRAAVTIFQRSFPFHRLLICSTWMRCCPKQTLIPAIQFSLPGMKQTCLILSITVMSGVFKTTAHDADVLLSYSSLSPRNGHNEKETGLVVNSFEGLLLETSLARLWVDWQTAHGMENIVIESPYLAHRALTIDMFESLKEIPAMEGDNFVFMHFLVPHPPFVFGPNGEMSRHDQAFTLSDGTNYSGTPRSYIKGYTEQVTYINQYLEETINYIINNSQTPPIIIIQGDHGPRMGVNFKNPQKIDLDGHFGNLNAYYLPNVDHTALYSTITPVNSFRVVFNSCFGTKFELLPDESYLSTSIEPFDFVNVTDLIK